MRYLILLFILVVSHGWATQVPAAKEIMAYTRTHLPTTGVIKREGDLIYLDVDDNYIYKLQPIIRGYGFKVPPYFGEHGLVGAHITLISRDEIQTYGIEQISEIGKRVKFKPQKCRMETPPHWDAIAKVYFIEVEAPTLTKIRKKYGLPDREFKFHITIGLKPKTEV